MIGLAISQLSLFRHHCHNHSPFVSHPWYYAILQYNGKGRNYIRYISYGRDAFVRTIASAAKFALSPSPIRRDPKPSLPSTCGYGSSSYWDRRYLL